MMLILLQVKKLSLLIMGIAANKYKEKLAEEQELLMRIADMMIEVYVAESAVLKTEKSLNLNLFQ